MSARKAKTGSSKTKPVIALVIFAVACAVVAAIGYFGRNNQIATLSLSTGDYTLQVARTKDQQTKGLSGQTSLATDAGMLFSYSAPDRRCFWMKDMQFPLDIIWLTADKQVIQVTANAQPSSYPQQFCADKTQYVIELSAGTAAQNDIQQGQTLNF